MFEGILPEIKQPNDITYESPKLMTLRFEDSEDIVVSVEKGANSYISDMYGIKDSTLKEVYKKSPELWRDLIKVCEDENKSQPAGFSLYGENNLFFVTNAHELIDIKDGLNEDNIESIINSYEDLKLDITERTRTAQIYTDGKDGLAKIILYSTKSSITDSYTPVIVIESNLRKSTYNVYTGILLFSSYTLIPELSYYASFKHYTDFITGFNVEHALEHSMENAKSLYDDYKQFEENSPEISARELLSLLSKVGYKLRLESDNDIGEIAAIAETESNEAIQRFFNTFKFTTGETATDILNLSEFRKIFRYNSLTFLDVLKILSTEYIIHEGAKITVDILISIMDVLYHKSDDNRQVQKVKEGIE